MRHNSVARRLYLAPALGLALVTAISACSSGSPAPAPPSPPASSSAPASSAQPSAPSAPSAPTGGSGASSSAVAQITTNWTTFFNSATPNSERVKLLENGQQYAGAITAFSASPLAAAVSSKVDSVKLTSATKATVKYDLTAVGQTVASGQTGTSVLQDGTWKVGDDVFCGLLTQASQAGITIPVPSACKSAG